MNDAAVAAVDNNAADEDAMIELVAQLARLTKVLVLDPVKKIVDDDAVVVVVEFDSMPFALHNHIHIIFYCHANRIDRQRRIAIFPSWRFFDSFSFSAKLSPIILMCSFGIEQRREAR